MTRLRGNAESFERPPGVEEGSVLTVFRVAPEDEGMRLDLFLVKELRRTSRTRAQEIIRVSGYSPDGARLKTNQRVRAEQRVLLWRAAWDEEEVPVDIPILYEDDVMIAVSKPALLPVHPTARYYRNTVIKIMQGQRPGEFISLVHRIDRETSGVLLLAKNPSTDRVLKMRLEAREGFEKMYVAMTRGVPRHEGKHEFRLSRAMRLDPDHKTGVKMHLWAGEGGMSASTRFRVLATRKHRGTEYAFVACALDTGRQHQIRLHLQSLGTPIVGDKLYGADESMFTKGADGLLTEAEWESLELPRHALHAAYLGFEHPSRSERIHVRAPLPDDMFAFWEGERVPRYVAPPRTAAALASELEDTPSETSL